MLKKICFIFLLTFFALTMKSHHAHTDDGLNDQHLSSSKGIKGRSFEEVCEHYNGVVCDKVAGFGKKCCSKGLIRKKKVCDTFGC
jgi:hypothetical protein